jgi:hypothetical protein
MSALNKGKHVVGEIDGVRCTIVESGLNAERKDFLKNLLEFNHFNVRISQESNPDGIEMYSIGVTDIIFNPVIAVYERSLKTPEGTHVSPAIWNQQTTIYDSRYWVIRRIISY